MKESQIYQNESKEVKIVPYFVILVIFLIRALHQYVHIRAKKYQIVYHQGSELIKFPELLLVLFLN